VLDVASSVLDPTTKVMTAATAASGIVFPLATPYLAAATTTVGTVSSGVSYA
jgi:hypothetical protein